MAKNKAEDANLKTLRIIIGEGGNRQCFDCGQKGVTYLNMTIGAFVCTTCSGILRGLTPPHRVKSISMATFTPEEIEFVRSHGNDESSKTWLGLWDTKRIIKQEHREFMVDKYERKRYFLEPASPLKSITTSNSSQQHQPLSQSSSQQKQQSAANNLAALKAISLTPPTSNRQHRVLVTPKSNGINGSNGTSKFQTQFCNGDDDNCNRLNNNSMQNGNSVNRPVHHPTNNLNLNASTVTLQNGHNGQNGHSIGQNGFSTKFTPDSEFVADFGQASVYNSTNSLSSNGSTNKGSEPVKSDRNANFADFENNQIYNAAGLPMSVSSLSNNSLNSSGGTFNSNSSLNSTPSADRYAALKDLDEHFRDVKVETTPIAPVPQGTPVNPFKTVNPFQQPQQQLPQQPPQQPQNYQNWAIPDQNIFATSNQSFMTNGFVGSPLAGNGFNNYYSSNTNGFLQQQSSLMNGQAVKANFNPFMATTTTANSNNPFL